MAHFLVTYKTDYADDFNICGFAIFTADALTAYLASLDSLRYPVSFGFGTNEQIDYNSKREILRDFTTQEITDEEYSVLTKLFLDGTFGHFPEETDWGSSFYDDEDWDDEDFEDDDEEDHIDNLFPG